MALIVCSECGRSISTRASHCIHCGCPLSQMEKSSSPAVDSPAEPGEPALELTTATPASTVTPAPLLEYTAITDPVEASTRPPKGRETEVAKPPAPDAPAAKRDSSVGVVSLLVAMAGLGTYVALDGHVGLWNFPSRVGYYLVSGTLLWMLFYAVIGRRYRGKLTFWSFAGIYCSLIIGSTIRHDSLERNGGTAATSLASDMERIRRAVEKGDATVSTSPVQAQGDMGKIEAYVKNFLDRMLTLRRENDAELARIGTQKLLEPTHLAQDKDLVESRTILTQSRAAYKQMRQSWMQLFDQYLQDLSALDVDPRVRADALRGAQQETATSRQRTTEMFDLQDQAMDECDSVLTLLTANQGRWQIIKGTPIFENDNLVSTYNSHLDKITQLNGRLEQIRKQSMDSSMTTINKLRR